MSWAQGPFLATSWGSVFVQRRDKCARGQQGRGEPCDLGELSCRVGRNVGTGSVVKIPWRTRVTVFYYGLGERFRKVCLGPGTVLSSGGGHLGDP